MQGLSIGLIYSYEPIQQLQRCVRSLQADLQDLANDIGAVQWILVCTPQVQAQDFSFFPGEIIYSPSSNLGWNRNLVLSKATGEGFYFTDPDCWLEKGSLIKLCRAFENQKNNSQVFAIAGSNILHSSDPDLEKAFRWIGKAKILNGGTSQLKVTVKDRSDWHSPTCHILYYRERIQEFQYSSRFHRVGEDLEFHFRLHQAGKRVLIYPDAHVWHEQPKSIYPYLRKVFFYGTAQTHLMRCWPSGFLNRRLIVIATFVSWSLLLFTLPEDLRWLFVISSFTAVGAVLFAEVLLYEGEKKFLFFSYFFALVSGAYLAGQISGLVWPLPSIQSEAAKLASKTNS